MNGKLAENVMHFGRLLRRAGLPIGPGQVLDGIRAAATVNAAHKPDFYWALAAVFVKRREELEIYEEAFSTFWRDPFGQDQAMTLLLDSAQRDMARPPETKRRVSEAWSAPVPVSRPRPMEDEQQERIDTVLTFASDEVLRTKDFEQMSAEELRRAKLLIERMRFATADILTRRRRIHHRGKIDLRRTLRKSLAGGGDLMPLAFSTRRRHPPALVILCDISGSMDRYSRMFLHFMHAITNDRDRVHTFLFGTRLTNVTRYLRQRDIDMALDKVSRVVEDWAGGTRIGRCLHDFNRDWSRRVLGQGAVVLFISDGLDRDGGEGLGAEMQRLHLSSRRLVWLNPLLRYEAFEPKSIGIRAIMPHVDEFRPVHNLDSLRTLIESLGRPGPRRMEGMRSWREMAA